MTLGAIEFPILFWFPSPCSAHHFSHYQSPSHPRILIKGFFTQASACAIHFKPTCTASRRAGFVSYQLSSASAALKAGREGWGDTRHQQQPWNRSISAGRDPQQSPSAAACSPPEVSRIFCFNSAWQPGSEELTRATLPASHQAHRAQQKLHLSAQITRLMNTQKEPSCREAAHLHEGTKGKAYLQKNKTQLNKQTPN